MQHLDRQLAEFAPVLETDVRLSKEEACKVATLVAAEVRFLPPEVKREVLGASPVPLNARYEELIAFQAWSDLATSARQHPTVVRAQVVVQNYICFVYLKDALFEVLSSGALSDSVVARCASFLSRGAVRDFRNAFSHANWSYKPDFSGFDCWVLINPRKASDGMRHFEVSQSDVDFWQTLARGVAYAAYGQLRESQ